MRPNFNRIVSWSITSLIAATILALCLSKASVPIEDPDLWWHLKTGQMIVETGTLPHHDDFAFTSKNLDSPREQAILRGYPVAQTTLYMLYSTMGGFGIMSARLLFCGVLIAIILLRSYRLGADIHISLAVLCACLAAFLSFYNIERPQAASFLFFALLMAILEQADRKERFTAWLFPFMLLWANTHGGFVIGDICLALFATGYTIRTGFNRKSGVICAWAAGGILASLVNPNGYAFFIDLMSIGEKNSFAFVQEYQSVWHGLLNGNRSSLITIVIAFICCIGIIVNRRQSLSILLIHIFIIAISVRYTRNAPFILLGLVPVAAVDIESILQRLRNHYYKTVTLYICCTVLTLSAIWVYPYSIKPTGAEPATVSWYPVKAADFVVKTPFQGNMFNEYNWGGYLIWKLYPRHRVFIDGRVLNERILDDYKRIGSGSLARTTEGRFAYEQLLDAYHIDIIIQSIIQTQGGQPLMGRLLDNPAWIPVYLDERAYIFIRGGTNNQIAATHRLNKGDFLRRMEGILCHSGKEAAEKNILGIADLLIYQNRLAEARMLLTKADLRHPGDALIRQRLLFIEKQLSGR